MILKMEQKNMGIYVHIPFCFKKCAYCDFYSVTDYGKEKRYFDALCRNIEASRAYYGKRTADTLFIGGGTPSSVDPYNIKKVIDKLKECFGFTSDAEITIEANPATLTEEKLRVYRECGINRISMGVQSAVDSELYELSRIHSFEEARKSFMLCRNMGFDNINLDVMMGIPGQSEKSLRYTLDTICELDPTHISVYMLSIEENTPFGRMKDKLDLPDEDIVSDMYLFACDLLKKRGYCHYEISNFAKENYACRHNMKYWKREDYVSFGTAAHSFVDHIGYSFKRDINKYVECTDFSDVLDEVYPIDENEQTSDEIIFGLRMSSGVELEKILSVCFFSKLEEYVKHGYAVIADGRFILTDSGMLVSNSIISNILT